MLTIATFMGQGIVDSSLACHIKNAKNNGLTEKEFVEIVTKLAFYTGGLMLGQRLKWEKNFIRKNVIIAC